MTPVKERMRQLRERRQAEGLIRVEVVLPRELLDRCRLSGETINDCLQRILLQSVSGNRLAPLSQPVSGDTAARQPLNPVSGDKSTKSTEPVSGDKPRTRARKHALPVSGDKLVVSQASHGQDIPVSGDRTSVINWIIIAKDAMRLSYQKIADALNEKEISTFSGRGTWQKGNVERYYKGKSD